MSGRGGGQRGGEGGRGRGGRDRGRGRGREGDRGRGQGGRGRGRGGRGPEGGQGLGEAFSGMEVASGGPIVSVPMPAPMPIPDEPINLGPLAAAPPRPRRPDFGTKGRQITLLSNWFKVEWKGGEIYQYAVQIKKLPYEETGEAGGSDNAPRRPARPPRATEGPLPSILCRAAMSKMAEEMRWPAGSWAFDGRANMYGCDLRTVPGDVVERELVTTLPGESKPIKFAVKVERVAILPAQALAEFFRGKTDDAAPHHVLQALDVILKHRMGMHTLVKPNIMAQGRSFLMWDAQTAQYGIGGGAQVWLGYKQAVRPCQTGLALTLDTAAGPVWDVGNPASPCRLSDFMYNILGGRDRLDPNRGLDGRQARSLDKALRGLRIQATHNGFKRTVVGVARNTPFTEKFEDANGRQVTVASYFQGTYQVAVGDRALPCVRVGNGRSLLPPEVCIVLPKQRVGRISGEQTAGMIRFSAQKPQDKQRFIEGKVREVAGEAGNEMRSFGISLASKMTDVQARVLPAPKLAYGGGKSSFDPKNFGSWNLKDLPFLEPRSLTSWAVVNLSTKRWEIEGVGAFVQEFIRVGRTVGMTLAANPPLVQAKGASPAVANLLGRAAEAAERSFKARPQLILVVLPDTDAGRYREVKQAGDSALGIPTQCMVAMKAKIGARDPRGQVQYIANVLMKVNAKLGGTNVSLSRATINSASDFIKGFGTKPFMIMGADVTHPGLGSSMPSIAAVVGSLDANATRYAARISAQPSTRAGKQVEEIIFNLKDIAKELLIEFYRATGNKRPERIIFYRDGVSEGQFDHVLQYEYEALRQACAELGDPTSGYAPPITFVVVQKRHQTRLFVRDPRDADRSGNVPPGVVVDRGITHPHDFAFFLNSHAGLQGTNKPVHYSVILDQNGFTADSMQEFTYWQAYTFARATRSVSMPAAAYYAHLAAFRGRALMRGDESEAGSVMSGEGPPPQLLPVNPALASRMFFI